MGVALHAHVSGQPFRLRPLRQALRHVLAQRSVVWIADTDRIAAAWRGGEPGHSASDFVSPDGNRRT